MQLHFWAVGDFDRTLARCMRPGSCPFEAGGTVWELHCKWMIQLAPRRASKKLVGGGVSTVSDSAG